LEKGTHSDDATPRDFGMAERHIIRQTCHRVGEDILQTITA
jgi:hypothetical protein